MPRRRQVVSDADALAQRSARRLRRDLGVNGAGVEVILHLRGQVLSLQAHVRELEAELARHSTWHHARLAQYRDKYYEASWLEIKGE
jgi:hypothetical protein